MARDIGSIDPDRASKLGNHEYYKKIQNELKEKTQTHNNRERKQQHEVQEEDDTKVNKLDKTDATLKAKKAMSIKDKVQIRSFRWEQDDTGDFQITEPDSSYMATSVDLKNEGTAIMKFMGVKIDFTEKLPHLKQSYMQNVIQTKSHNFFLAKYAGFKMGMVGQLLSSLGVSAQELEELKKQAIETTVVDLLEQVCENIYNMELVTLVFGKTKKARKPMAKFQEIQAQLLTQLKFMDKADYWSNTRVLEEQSTQCRRIIDEFEAEKETVSSQFNYFEFKKQTKKEEKKSVSVKIDDPNKEELSIFDVRKKLDKLNLYIRRASDRIKKHDRNYRAIAEKDKKEQEMVKAGLKVMDKKQKEEINI
ncbi:hypothetical protein HOG98_07490 [bacterium]|jgi:hypothetical protein|nr:hypothetical protein [bacterium]